MTEDRHLYLLTVDIAVIVPIIYTPREDDSDLEVLLVRRGKPPFEGAYVLPGGHLEPDDESLEDAACRELREETAALANPSNLVLIGTYSAVDRDPRGRVITAAYLAPHAAVPPFHEGPVHGLVAGSDATEARFVNVAEARATGLGFDHDTILTAAVAAYRTRAAA